jgi:hypothetical protein
VPHVPHPLLDVRCEQLALVLRPPRRRNIVEPVRRLERRDAMRGGDQREHVDQAVDVGGADPREELAADGHRSAPSARSFSA